MNDIIELIPQGEEVIALTRPSLIGRWRTLTGGLSMVLVGLFILAGSQVMSSSLPGGDFLWSILDRIANPTGADRYAASEIAGRARMAAEVMIWVRGHLGPIFILLGAAAFFWAVLSCTRTAYVVTERRVLVSSGVLVRSLGEITAHRIRGVEMRRTLLGSMFGFGSLAVHGFGGEYVLLSDARVPLTILRAVESIQA
jgi:hypothetical protein